MLQLLTVQFSLSLNYIKTLDAAFGCRNVSLKSISPWWAQDLPAPSGFAASVKINAPKLPAALDEQCSDFCFVPLGFEGVPSLRRGHRASYKPFSFEELCFVWSLFKHSLLAFCWQDIHSPGIRESEPGEDGPDDSKGLNGSVDAEGIPCGLHQNQLIPEHGMILCFIFKDKI